MHRPRKLTLFLDGTGNKFQGNDSDSNIVKMFRMLDRTAQDQFHYYQPGIGTYVVSHSLSRTGRRARLKSWYLKAKDSAIGSSFDHHVVGAYRFLMRYYNHGDELYIFGFSRGAYVARFLAEMLDYVGLLSHGNEEMVAFAWKTFAEWSTRRNDNTAKGTLKKHEMYKFMKGFRETFSRPVRRIRFLGLFDTVNSVPRFESAWMARSGSRFPYTAHTSAKVIRHAVSVDERRAKFRQDLLYQRDLATKEGKERAAKKPEVRDRAEQAPQDRGDMCRQSSVGTAAKPTESQVEDTRGRQETLEVPFEPQVFRARSRSTRSQASQATGNIAPDAASEALSVGPLRRHSEFDGDSEEDDQDIDEVWFAGGHGDVGGGWEILPHTKSASHVPLTWMVREAMKAGLGFDIERVIEMGCMDALQPETTPRKAPSQVEPESCQANQQDEEGNQPSDLSQPFYDTIIPDITIRRPSGLSNLSDIAKSNPSPECNDLEQAGQSGLGKDKTKSTEQGQDGGERRVEDASASRSPFHDLMHKAHVARIHDSLSYDCGMRFGSVLAWRLMEYLPFRRMDLQADGSWKPIRWPLPCGETRDIPANARVHGSVIRRLREDPKYRPGNLIIGGGGRGVRIAPEKYGTGEWTVVDEEGDLIGEVWMRKSAVEDLANR